MIQEREDKNKSKTKQQPEMLSCKILPHLSHCLRSSVAVVAAVVS